MSTELLNWVCDLAGSSDAQFVEFLNNRNTIPPSIVYILMMRSSVNYVVACVNAGFVLDENCMSIACIMKNVELIKLCIDNGVKPTENDVRNLIIQCVETRINYRRQSGYFPNLTGEIIYDKNKFFKFILRFAIGESTYKFSSYNGFCKGLYTLLNNIPKVSGQQFQYLCKQKRHAHNVIECLNYLLNNGYIMTPNNWTLFDESTINIKNINTDDKESYAKTLCSSNTHDTIGLIKKNKIKLNNECLEIAIKNNNINIITYILNDMTFTVDIDTINLVIKHRQVDHIELFVERCTKQLDDDIIDNIISIALEEHNDKLLKFVNDKYNKTPDKKTILQYVINANPCAKYLYENNLLVEKLNNDCQATPNNNSHPAKIITGVDNVNTTQSLSDHKTKLWFM